MRLESDQNYIGGTAHSRKQTYNCTLYLCPIMYYAKWYVYLNACIKNVICLLCWSTGLKQTAFFKYVYIINGLL